ncbi:acyl-coenzyme A thioesterase 13-like [Scaptodrosophila lebanonensis]|uniref:Acyl-coenzyme A thioesterase 13 n=1 Tax=Drosophila lebanonensis TaxID=7225 RepID=A0A6J2TAK2_DROLE|nr:acyl-coenzyme A thioesterase 13 [Scaptodrosophila lebanonensis]XP_030372265.1 acyl-coenzyme A thioesterase 13-like [Scaptodrosophila lebanonensis]
MAAKRGVDFLKTVAEYSAKCKSFDGVIHMVKITDGGDGRCVGEFTVEAEHLNRKGSLHGGLTAAILDNITTYALMSKGSHPGVSTSLNVSYLAAAMPGDIVEVDANTVRAGRKLAYIECVLRRKSDGAVIATGGQTKFVDMHQDAKN